tara:strand:- start:538 stop:792 length:255 start_codon:yes stop_codon:yes gene_type:complete
MGFLKPQTTTTPMPELVTGNPELSKKITPVAPITPSVETTEPETTQPGDEGKQSKKKKNKQSTILTSVTGINQPATLGRKSLLG